MAKIVQAWAGRSVLIEKKGGRGISFGSFWRVLPEIHDEVMVWEGRNPRAYFSRMKTHQLLGKLLDRGAEGQPAFAILGKDRLLILGIFT